MPKQPKATYAENLNAIARITVTGHSVHHSPLRDVIFATGVRPLGDYPPKMFLSLFEDFRKLGLPPSDFARFLRDTGHTDAFEATNPAGGKPDDLITNAVALRQFHTSRQTIKRRIEDGQLTDYRDPGHAENATYLLSIAELERLFKK